MPSISFSGEIITRCPNTGYAACFISSGVTKSLPANAANPFEAFKIAKEARGEAPNYKKLFSRVFWMIFAIYSIN